MHETQHIARHLVIHGIVQGVSYRATAQREADRLGLSGWVRNRSNGCVEALVAGPSNKVEAFIAWAHRGPSRARVDRIDAQAHEHPGHHDFRMLPTV